MEYIVEEQLYLYPTPAGAFYAVSNPSANQAQKVLNAILHLNNTPKMTLDRIRYWASMDAEDVQLNNGAIDNTDAAANLLIRMQDAGWIQGCKNYHTAPDGNLEECLPSLLKPLSSDGKVLLADEMGLNISHVGFKVEIVDQLSALSADVANVQEKHAQLILDNRELFSNAWANVDAAGNSQLGFWPLYIGGHRLVLAVAGLPRLNQQFLTQLIWVLSIRYGANE